MFVFDTVMMTSNVKLLKKTRDLICFTHKENNIYIFVKIFYMNNDKILNEYNRETNINKYILKNIKSLKYYTKILDVLENVIPEYNYNFIEKQKCNIIIYEHSWRPYIKILHKQIIFK